MLVLFHRLADSLDRRSDPLLTTLARLVFAAVLLQYYWVSGLTKLGDGITGLFQPSVGGYAQIWPRAMEAVGFNTSEMSWFQWLVVVAGTWAEFILPLLIVIGLLTRFAALGMIGFIIVQSLTDIVGHMADPTTIGAWFDRFSNALILDQRSFWVLCLLILVMRGPGPLSVDRVLFRKPD